MARKVFLKYPCGKLFELRFPIVLQDSTGASYTVLPGMDNYFEQAKIKFQINNLKVVENEVPEQTLKQPISFVSLSKRVRCVD